MENRHDLLYIEVELEDRCRNNFMFRTFFFNAVGHFDGGINISHILDNFYIIFIDKYICK